MTTATTAVLDGKMDEYQIGVLHKRVDEIKRRINEGTISFYEAITALQLIVEGRTEQLKPCTRPHRSEPVPFVRPPVAKNENNPRLRCDCDYQSI